MRRRSAPWIAAAAVALGATALFAQGAKPPADPEPDIRRTAFAYYFGMATGDLQGVQGASAASVFVLKDGAMAQRDEKRLRPLLEGVAQRLDSAGVGANERGTMAARAVSVVDEATLQYIGADTATVTLTVRPASTKTEGDLMMELVLRRTGGKWRVVQEISDSAPVPPAYLNVDGAEAKPPQVSRAPSGPPSP